MGAELILRRGRSDDLPAVERICTQTWDWGDYVPLVWEEWLADPQGFVLVGEIEGQAVALSKITFLAADQVWLSGMRVDPAFRGRGVAGRFLDYGIDYACQQGARVVRLATGDTNAPVHTLAHRAGMSCLGSFAVGRAESLPEGDLPVVLAPEHEPQVRALIDRGPFLRQARGLYSVHWTWQELSPERVAQFLAHGQMVARIDAQGQMRALASVHLDPVDEEMWIGFVEGDPDSVEWLARAVRAHAAQVGAEALEVMLADVDSLRDAFHAAGYVTDDQEGELLIFEKRLTRDGQGHGE